jgi:hypothetical protein
MTAARKRYLRRTAAAKNKNSLRDTHVCDIVYCDVQE